MPLGIEHHVVEGRKKRSGGSEEGIRMCQGKVITNEFSKAFLSTLSTGPPAMAGDKLLSLPCVGSQEPECGLGMIAMNLACSVEDLVLPAEVNEKPRSCHSCLFSLPAFLK